MNAQIIFLNDTTVCGIIRLFTSYRSDINELNEMMIIQSLTNIGFPFEFYGNTYTSLVVCDNGYITFDTY